MRLCFACGFSEDEEKVEPNPADVDRSLLKADREDNSTSAAMTSVGAGLKASARAPAAADFPPQRLRLQEFLKDYAKEALHGISVEVLDPDTGHRLEAVSILDPSLSQLQLQLGMRNANGEVSRAAVFRHVELADITDAGSFESASTAELLSPGALKAAEGGGVCDRLVALSFADDTPPLLLLEASALARDRFLLCAKVLRLYAQTHGARSASQ